MILVYDDWVLSHVVFILRDVIVAMPRENTHFSKRSRLISLNIIIKINF